MKLKTLLLVILAVPAIGYALIYGYVWIQTKWDLDRLAKELAPAVDFRYGSIGLSPTGTVSVSQLSFVPAGLGETIGIDRVEVKTPGVDFILSGSRSLREGKLPRRLGLAFTGIRIDTDGQLWEAIRRLGAENDRLPANGLACDIASIATMQGRLANLTPSQIVIDLEQLLEAGQAPGTASLHLNLRQRDYGQVSLDLDFADIPEPFTRFMDPPRLSALAAKLSLDPEYAREAQQYCAEASRMPADRFLDTLLAQDDRAYLKDIGLIPGPGLRTLLQGFLDGEAVEARLAVPPGLDLASIKLYKPADIPRLLSLQVAASGSPIADLSFKTELPVAAREPKPATASPVSGARPSAAAPADISFADLERYLDSSVLITLRDGRERRGVVDQVGNGIVYLKSQLQTGSFTMEIRERDTAQIRLLGSRDAR